jgi:signal transduction histidine kinase
MARALFKIDAITGERRGASRVTGMSVRADDDERALFAAEDASAEAPRADAGVSPWVVVIVDDDRDVHAITRIVLQGYRYKDRPIELLSAHSAGEARAIFARRRDVAVALIDVVMETDDAGLQLTRDIREAIGNRRVRIILRTGQAGHAPEREVIVDYDINDYKTKTELTVEKMFVMMTAALRGYHDLVLIEEAFALRAAKEAAEAANRAKSDFLALMSHELRTPINAIIGYSEMVVEEASELGVDTILSDVKRIGSAGKHLLSMVNNIMDLSKIEAGMMDVYLESFDVAEMLSEVESVAQALAQKNANQLVIVCPPDIGAMHSDVTKVRQVIFNLLSNALKFTQNGRVTVALRRLDGGPAERIEITITDTGIGMTPEQMGRLFRAYAQADASTARRFGGTGLGLTIVKQFCELLGGDVTVDSTPGVGTSFTLQLPRRTAPPLEITKPEIAAGLADALRSEIA